MPDEVSNQIIPREQEPFFILEKYDPFQGIATGVATGAKTDRDKEKLDYSKSKPFFEAWSESVHKDSGGKSFGNVRLQHDEKKPAGKLNWIKFDDAKELIRVEAKIVDPIAKDMLAEGVLTGFSIGGRYVSKTPQTDGTIVYVADPCEISVVDRPAYPEATFESVKADGSTELRKFSKYASPAMESPGSSSHAQESFDAIRAKVQGALDAKYNVNTNPKPGEAYTWVWIKDIFAGSVVYSVCEGGKGDGELYECTYTEDGDTMKLSDPIEVVGTYVPANKAVRYLVPDGEHLPFTDESGNISHRLMGAAWAALHGGYRGNKYEGSDKDKAIARLKRLYESEGMETPDTSKAIGEAIELLKTADIESSNEQILGLLESLEKQLETTTMSDELKLDKAARHSVQQKIQAAKKAVTDHMTACKAHGDAMHAHMDGITKVLGGGPESMDEGGKPDQVTHEDPKVTPQAPGASATADKAATYVSVGKDAQGNELFKRVDPNAPPPTAQEIAKEVVKTMLEVQKQSVEAIGERSKVRPFVKAATKEADNGGGPADASEQMTDADWEAYRKGDQAAMRKAQRCTQGNWQPTPSRIANREAARQGVAR